MTESRDASRMFRIDWPGALLAVSGLGSGVFALLEWPRSGTGRPLVFAAIACSVVCLAALVIVERRVPDPMLPIGLFRSRTFTLANLLTLLLYGALGTVFWLVPLNLIQVQHYTATAAGAAFLPFPVLMFLLSRWSGGLIARIGSRLPLTRPPSVKAPRCERSEETDVGRMPTALCIAKAGHPSGRKLFGYPNSRSTYGG